MMTLRQMMLRYDDCLFDAGDAKLQSDAAAMARVIERASDERR